MLWDQFGRRLRDGASRLGRFAVLFDGGCGLCQRTVGVLGSLDLMRRVEFFDVAGEWSLVEKRFPDIDREACLIDMHVVTPGDRVRHGFDGYRALSWALPLGWILLPLLYLPGARPIGKRVYSEVAARRSHAACPLPAGAPDAGKSREGRA